MTRARLFIGAFLCLLLLTHFIAAQNSKLTPRTAQAFRSAPDSEPIAVWLYFDSTRVEKQPIVLSERALRRRAKVNAEDLLIDKYDYRLDPGLLSEIQASGVRIKYSSRWLKAVAVEADRSQAEELSGLSGLKRIDLVDSYRVMRDVRVKKADESTNKALGFSITDYGPTLGQNLFTKATKLHGVGLSGKGVLIAMFDSGFNTHHRVFDSTSIVAQHDFINDADSVTGADCPDEYEGDQQDRHGTLTFGAVGGFLRDTLIGIAYGADYALAKTEITCGGVEFKQEEYNWIAAAEWADSLGADIISASLGYYVFQDVIDPNDYTRADLNGHTALVTIAAEVAASKNILVVTAAGNERQAAWGTIIFPADGDSVLAVGAVDASGEIAAFSSPGPTADGRIKPDIVSLGVNVFTARSFGETFTLASGTSLSTPLVAGGAALAMEFDSSLTAMELLQSIRETGDRASHPDNNYGYGIYNGARSAEIAEIDNVGLLRVAQNDSIVVPVTASGRSEEPPSISSPNLPAGVSLTDFGNGTGRLRIIGRSENLGTVSFPLVASIPDFAETTFVSLTTYLSFEGLVRAGPNPFRDSLRIFVDTSAGRNVSVSIFNSAGEKVWESLNNSGFSTDVITWDGRNNAGRETAPGVYLVLVSTERMEKRLKMLKIK